MKTKQESYFANGKHFHSYDAVEKYASENNFRIIEVKKMTVEHGHLAKDIFTVELAGIFNGSSQPCGYPHGYFS